jgi:hypothetical protein
LRHIDPDHLPRIHTRNLHLRAFGDAVQISEFGIQPDVARESLMAAANKEDTEGEQCHAGNDEESYSKISFRH